MAAGGHFGWRKITFDRISHHFRSILNFLFFKMVASGHFASRCLPKSIGTYLYSRSVATSNMKLIGAFVINLWSAQDFSSYFYKMAVGGHFGFPIFSRSSMVVSNMDLIRALVSQLRETQAVACGGDGGCGGVQTKTIISQKFQISGI